MMVMLILLSCIPGQNIREGSPALSPSAPTTPAPAARKAEDRWEKTLAEAKKEGVVLVYANVLPETRAAVPPAFEKKYGIRADFLVGTGSELGKRFVTEAQAGVHAADVLLLGATTFIVNVKPQKVLQPIEPLLILSEVKDNKKWFGERIPFVDTETQVLGFLVQYNSGLMRNTQLVKESELTSFLDLLKPQWKGKIAMYDPSIAGSGSSGIATLVEKLGYEQAMNYLSQLMKQQEAAVTRDRRVQVEWVARGKYAIALWPSPDAVSEFIVLEATVAPVRTKEGGWITSAAGVMGVSARPSNPNAATIFVNWLMSREGQGIFSQSVKTPSARTDVTIEGIPPALLVQPGEKPYWDDEKGLLLRGKLLEEAARVISGK